MKYCHLWQHEWTYRILYLVKSEKGKYYVRYMKSKKRIQMNLFPKQKQTP